LEDNGIKPHKNIVVLCPGASFTNKQWDVENFTLLAQRILTDLSYQIVVLGGFKEQKVCKSIADNCKGSILSVAGVFDLSQSAALINRAQLTVANDTGMLHVSEALNVPVVGIYGPTVRQFGYFPILEQSRVAQVELECRPCTKMGMNYCPQKPLIA
jgi:heptosyltransferase-2